MFTIKLLAASCSFLVGYCIPTGCDGCERDEQTWGGGSVNEVYEYAPGMLDEDGNCLPDCSYDELCRFNGSLKFYNNSGSPRDLFDEDGVNLGTVQHNNSLTVPVTVKSGCGAVGEAAPSFDAEDGGGTVTSSFVFYCTPCLEEE